MTCVSACCCGTAWSRCAGYPLGEARNQRHALVQWPVVVAGVKEQLESLIADLSERIDALEAEIAAVLAEGAWAASATYLQSITGIGTLTAAWLLVATL